MINWRQRFSSCSDPPAEGRGGRVRRPGAGVCPGGELWPCLQRGKVRVFVLRHDCLRRWEEAGSGDEPRSEPLPCEPSSLAP